MAKIGFFDEKDMLTAPPKVETAKEEEPVKEVSPKVKKKNRKRLAFAVFCAALVWAYIFFFADLGLEWRSNDYVNIDSAAVLSECPEIDMSYEEKAWLYDVSQLEIVQSEKESVSEEDFAHGLIRESELPQFNMPVHDDMVVSYYVSGHRDSAPSVSVMASWKDENGNDFYMSQYESYFSSGYVKSFTKYDIFGKARYVYENRDGEIKKMAVHYGLISRLKNYFEGF